MNETPAPPSLPDIPETDDPVVLRELLRQAREHLRLRESIEQMLEANVARTEALLVEARAAQQGAGAIDPAEIRAAVDDARAALRDAREAVERLATLVPAEGAPTPDAGSASVMAAAEPVAKSPDGPRTVEVLVEDVTSPALARSLQQHLASLDHVARAEVRELAEGLLRITVETTQPLTGASIAGWEPDRDRTIRTKRDDVLEIELG